jgi:hypothetical protein
LFDDDAQPIWRAQHGDAEAVAQIYDRCQPSIFTYLCYRLGDQALAEDLMTAFNFPPPAVTSYSITDIDTLYDLGHAGSSQNV